MSFKFVIICLFSLHLGSYLGSPSQVQAKECIGLITSSSTDTFWTHVRNGAQDAANDLGYDLYYRGAVNELNFKAQPNIINAVEKLGCAGLVMAPNHPSRAEDVARLKSKGIPTVYIDRDTGGADVIGVISTDNFSAGKFAAKKMAEVIGEGRNVLLVRLDKNVDSTTKREKGFIEGAKKANLNVVDTEFFGLRIGDIRSRLSSYFANNNKKIDGIFAVNESTTMGVLLSLEKNQHHALIIGFDMRKEFSQAINQGVLYGVIVQKGYQMGYEGVKLVDKYINRKSTFQKQTIFLDIEFISRD